MAGQVTHSPSRIPLPVKSSPTPSHIPVTGIYVKEIVCGSQVVAPLQQSPVSHSKENGNFRHSPQVQRGNKLETYLMTGEMIINSNSSATGKLIKSNCDMKTPKESHIPRLGQSDQKQAQLTPVSDQVSEEQEDVSLPELHSRISEISNSNSPQKLPTSPSLQRQLAPVQDITYSQVTMTGQIKNFPFVQAPVAEMEELSDLSQSSCSGSELGLEADSAASSPCLPVQNLHTSPAHSPDTDSSSIEQAAGVWGQQQAVLPGSRSASPSDLTCSDVINFVHGGHISDPDLAGRGFVSSDPALSHDGGFLSDETLIEKEGTLSADNINSKMGPGESSSQALDSGISGDKCGNTERLLVRTSKSHENYLQAANIALVSIDIDDNLAYSLDALTYHDSPDSSLDNMACEPVQMSRSLDNSPEKKSEKSFPMERDFLPGYVNPEDSKSAKLKLGKQWVCSEGVAHSEMNNSGNSFTDSMSSPSRNFHSRAHNNGLLEENSRGDSLQLGFVSEEADTDSLYHQPSKAVDRPSAERLAKRLYHLEGFRKSDVSRHLCKKNDFSNLVAEEYLKFFDFQLDTLDLALRKFLQRFSLYGETQERERVLTHFSHRFMECNPGSFNSEDACHTLTCAIMLLNSDLHSPNVSRRMTCQEFIENLAELNEGDNFSKEVLKAIYQAIKSEPLEWAVDEVTPDEEGIHAITDPTGLGQGSLPQTLGSNPFLEVPDPSKTTEYKKGYVMRKCCMESDRRKTPFGKRGWKMLYAVLRDMILYQYKDEHQLKKGHFVESAHNAIRIHHALATKALDYTKKQHVFRLQTADWAEYLFQTGDSKELQEWVDIINLVAASLSAPVLPGAVGARTKFQRQFLPSSCTCLNLREQLHSHETKIHDLEQELQAHHTVAPEKGAKSSVIQDYLEKESYLEFEIKRFKTYVYLLQGKLLAFPELDQSLVETTIGEYEEMGAGPSFLVSNQSAPSLSGVKSGPVVKAVQRSMSDRYTYRTALFQTECSEYDMV